MTELDAPRTVTREFPARLGATWWLRSGHYFWYMAREFTALPLALWLLWLLVEIKRAGDGAGRYGPHGSDAFVLFSAVCLPFALYHSITFLRLSGVIIRVKLFGRVVAPRLIVLSQFGLWAVASIAIGAALIGFGR